MWVQSREKGRERRVSVSRHEEKEWTFLPFFSKKINQMYIVRARAEAGRVQEPALSIRKWIISLKCHFATLRFFLHAYYFAKIPMSNTLVADTPKILYHYNICYLSS
jgi:hypothetical protein